MKIKSTLLIALLIAPLISSCGNSSPSNKVRVTLSKCTNGLVKDSSYPTCLGMSELAGTLDFKLDENLNKLVVRVVKGGKDFEKGGIFSIDNCVIWNEENWNCESGSAGWANGWVMKDGHFHHYTYYLNSGVSIDFTGMAKTGMLYNLAIVDDIL